jgi:hypothetical protein
MEHGLSKLASYQLAIHELTMVLTFEKFRQGNSTIGLSVYGTQIDYLVPGKSVFMYAYMHGNA